MTSIHVQENIKITIFNKKFAEIVVSDKDTQFNFLKIYPLFKKNQNLLLLWNQHYEKIKDNIFDSLLMLNFIILAFENDLIEYKMSDVINITDKIDDVSNKELIKSSIIKGKIKTCDTKISLINNSVTQCDNPITNIKKISHIAFAQELTRIFAHFTEKVTYHELLYVAQHDTKIHKNENELMQPIEILIDYSNKLGYMVLHTILIEDKNDLDRIKTIKHILKICEELKILNNYHALFSLLGGLGNSSIQRLDTLWKNKKYTNTFTKLTEIINPTGNHKKYRETINENLGANIIHYIGVTISDLKHALEYNLYDIHNVCFNMNSYNTILKILNNFKNMPVNYDIEKNDIIFKWISNIKIVYTDSYFYDISKNIKPNVNKQLNEYLISNGLVKENLSTEKANIHKHLIDQLNSNKPNENEISKNTYIKIEEIMSKTTIADEELINAQKISFEETSVEEIQFGTNQFEKNQFDKNQFGTNQFEKNQFGTNQFEAITQLKAMTSKISNEDKSVCDSVEEIIKLTNAQQIRRNKHKSMPAKIKSPNNPIKLNNLNDNLEKIKLWTIDDVQNWLCTINMEMYCDIFMKEEIDGIALCNLTNNALKYDLYIAKLGHRLKILSSIGLCASRDDIP